VSGNGRQQPQDHHTERLDLTVEQVEEVEFAEAAEARARAEAGARLAAAVAEAHTEHVRAIQRATTETTDTLLSIAEEHGVGAEQILATRDGAPALVLERRRKRRPERVLVVVVRGPGREATEHVDPEAEVKKEPAAAAAPYTAAP